MCLSVLFFDLSMTIEHNKNRKEVFIICVNLL